MPQYEQKWGKVRAAAYVTREKYQQSSTAPAVRLAHWPLTTNKGLQQARERIVLFEHPEYQGWREKPGRDS